MRLASTVQTLKQDSDRPRDQERYRVRVCGAQRLVGGNRSDDTDAEQPRKHQVSPQSRIRSIRQHR